MDWTVWTSSPSQVNWFRESFFAQINSNKNVFEDFFFNQGLKDFQAMNSEEAKAQNKRSGNVISAKVPKFR